MMLVQEIEWNKNDRKNSQFYTFILFTQQIMLKKVIFISTFLANDFS